MNKTYSRVGYRQIGKEIASLETLKDAGEKSERN
jgi:hypothetical protein